MHPLTYTRSTIGVDDLATGGAGVSAAMISTYHTQLTFQLLNLLLKYL